MSRIDVTLRVNSDSYPLEIEPHRTLLEVLRDELALIGTKANCLSGECGACTVLVDGRAVNACLFLAVRAHEKPVLTVEGLPHNGELHPLQIAFIQEGAVQCGYCTPGMLMSARALLDANAAPTDEEIVRALAGNLCRCTGYFNIWRAMRAAIGGMRNSE
jgi:aerobic-type carbon monoxide dehydrogenase small subunit (CoxS/CutS family)